MTPTTRFVTVFLNQKCGNIAPRALGFAPGCSSPDAISAIAATHPQRVGSAIKRLAILAVAGCLWSSALAPAGRATIITFGNTNHNLGLSPYTEGGFTFQTGNTTSPWAVTTTTGNPPACLAEGFSSAFPGDEVDAFLTGGGLFTFNSFDVNAVTSSDTINLIGDVGGVATQQLLGVGNVSTSNTWVTRASGFGAPIDRLKIIFVSKAQFAVSLDNLNLTPVTVPEPASLTLLGLAAAALLVYRWRRRRRAA
jgi:hypothetical protein